MALNIADLFEHAVDAAPDNRAVMIGDRAVTYAELETEANKLAHFLSSRGVGHGDHIGIYAKNSIEHVVAVLAIVKIRAVNINVNYRYVENELNYLFDNAEMVALIHERSYAPLVAACAPNHERLHTFVALPDVTDPANDSDVSSFGSLSTTTGGTFGVSDCHSKSRGSPTKLLDQSSSDDAPLAATTASGCSSSEGTSVPVSGSTSCTASSSPLR